MTNAKEVQAVVTGATAAATRATTRVRMGECGMGNFGQKHVAKLRVSVITTIANIV